MRILGPEATLYGDDALDQARWQDYFLNQFNVRIGGGTDEVQKNGIAERSLGLPRSRRPTVTCRGRTSTR